MGDRAAMRITYDSEADVLYLGLRRALVDESEEVAPNVVIDLDAEGRAVGIEIGAASRQVDGNPLALSLELLLRREGARHPGAAG